MSEKSSQKKAVEDRKEPLVADLLKQREAAIKDFNEKLANSAVIRTASRNEITTGSQPRPLNRHTRTNH